MIYYEFLKWGKPDDFFTMWRKYTSNTLQEALEGLKESKKYPNAYHGFIIDSNGKIYKEFYKKEYKELIND